MKPLILLFAVIGMTGPSIAIGQVSNQGDQVLHLTGTLTNGLHYTSMVLHLNTRTITYNTQEMGGFTSAGQDIDYQAFAYLYEEALRENGLVTTNE